MNVRKSGVWATCPRLRARLKGALWVAGRAVPLLMEDRCLGTFMSFTRRKCSSKIQRASKEWRNILKRIESLYLPLPGRAHMVGTLVLPRALFGCGVSAPAETVLKALRGACCAAVCGQANKWRAAEACFGLLTKGHTTDPFCLLCVQHTANMQACVFKE